jgi:hypothetical protein
MTLPYVVAYPHHRTHPEFYLPQNVAYHDIVRGDLYMSSDEGNFWQRATDIPQGEAAMFIEHPFNNRMVSVVYPALFFTSQSVMFWTLA